MVHVKNKLLDFRNNHVMLQYKAKEIHSRKPCSMTGFFFFFFNETLPTFSLLTCYIIQSLIMFESFNIHMHVKTAKGKRATGQRIEKSRKIRAISELQLSFKFPVHTWRSASFTFISAYFSCSSDRVMPVYLHPVRWTASMAKVPQPQPISRIS